MSDALPTYSIYLPSNAEMEPGLASHWLMGTNRLLELDGKHETIWGMFEHRFIGAAGLPSGFYVNFHNSAHDVGAVGGKSGGIGWGFGNGVSALAFTNPPHALHVEQMKVSASDSLEAKLLPDPGEKWMSIVFNITFGRTDGTTKKPGSIYVCINGDEANALHIANANILQRALSPFDGRTYVQTRCEVWEGGPYLGTAKLPAPVTSEHVLMRIGTTLKECYDDRPVLASQWGSKHVPGKLPDYGDSKATLLTPGRTVDDFVMPASLAQQLGIVKPTSIPVPIPVPALKDPVIAKALKGITDNVKALTDALGKYHT